ncbi:MAG: lipocalin family protein, partial [Segatella copri]|nr:lipocalin family protein [Segatella copri]
MKKLFTLLVIALFACGFAACSSDDEEPEEPALEVTPANLHGTWKLVEWNNGEQVPEGTYCYIVFNRKEQTFEMYQKFDSMYGRHITGSFAIKNDPYQGYIISGSYDY